MLFLRPRSFYENSNKTFRESLSQHLILCSLFFWQPDVDANGEAADQGQPDADAGGGPNEAAAIVGPICPQLFGAAPYPGHRCFSIQVSKNAKNVKDFVSQESFLEI